MRIRDVFALPLVGRVCFAILEGVHLLNYEFDPYKNIRLSPNFHETRGVHHSAQGFRRNQDSAREKPEDTLRVFLMGGSTAYGLESFSILPTQPIRRPPLQTRAAHGDGSASPAMTEHH